MSEITCPMCKKTIDEETLEKEYHKLGRQAKCPKCKKYILFTAQPKNLYRDKTGKLIRRKNRHKNLK